MSDPRDFEEFEDDIEPPKPPWWRQRRVLVLGGASLLVLVLFAISHTKPHQDVDSKNGQSFIGVVVPYTPAKAAPPPTPVPHPLPPILPAAVTPPPSVSRPAMLSYVVKIHDPPTPAAPVFPPQTGMKIGTAQIPGVKASPAIDDTYMLMPGLLPCVLDTAIESDLPGPFMCHLPGPVYSAKGVLLLDARTQVIGRYDTMKNNGSNRLEAVSTYAWTPNGVMVPLTGEPTGDDLGRSGLSGAVDNHYFQRFGGAIILDLTQSALGIVQADVSKGGNTYISTNGSDNLARQVLQATINMPPTFSKHQGSAIALWITNPIDFSDSYRIRASR